MSLPVIYANKTSVTVARSKAELEDLVMRRHGGTAFLVGQRGREKAEQIAREAVRAIGGVLA